MAHFNFIPVNARLVAKSHLPGAAAPSPYAAGVSSTCTALGTGPSTCKSAIGSGRVQSPSKPVRPAMAPCWARSSQSCVFRLFFFYSPSPSPSPLDVSSRFTNSQRKQTKTSLAKSYPFLDPNASWISIIQYYSPSHSFLPSRNNKPRITTDTAR